MERWHIGSAPIAAAGVLPMRDGTQCSTDDGVNWNTPKKDVGPILDPPTEENRPDPPGDMLH